MRAPVLLYYISSVIWCSEILLPYTCAVCNFANLTFLNIFLISKGKVCEYACAKQRTAYRAKKIDIVKELDNNVRRRKMWAFAIDVRRSGSRCDLPKLEVSRRFNEVKLQPCEETYPGDQDHRGAVVMKLTQCVTGTCSLHITIAPLVLQSAALYRPSGIMEDLASKSSLNHRIHRKHLVANLFWVLWTRSIRLSATVQLEILRTHT